MGQESGLSWVDLFLVVPTGLLGAPQLVSRAGWRVQDSFPRVWSLLGMAGWLHSVATVDWNFSTCGLFSKVALGLLDFMAAQGPERLFRETESGKHRSLKAQAEKLAHSDIFYL